MAEILLSLTIIGVVAAITLPSLTGNINERTWNTQRKALYARMSQAIALMPALNGYGKLSEDASGSVTTDTAAETFITDGLSKVLKINNICDADHIQDCGITTSFTNRLGVQTTTPKTLKDLKSTLATASYDFYAGGTTEGTGTHYVGSYSTINTKAAAFETANGESIILYYAPSCVADMGENGVHMGQQKVCVNMIYDLNGNKGPNTVGKDIGVITVFYPTDSIVVAPFPLAQKITNTEYPKISSACAKLNNEYRMPNKEELYSIYVNSKLFGETSGNYPSSTKFRLPSGSMAVWMLSLATGFWGFSDHPNDLEVENSFCTLRY